MFEFLQAHYRRIPVVFQTEQPNNYLLSFEQYNYHDLAKKLKLLENSNELIKYSEQVQTYLEQILEDGKMIEKFTNILEKKL